MYHSACLVTLLCGEEIKKIVYVVFIYSISQKWVPPHCFSHIDFYVIMEQCHRHEIWHEIWTQCKEAILDCLKKMFQSIVFSRGIDHMSVCWYLLRKQFIWTIMKNLKMASLHCPNFMSMTLFHDEIKINMSETVGGGLTFVRYWNCSLPWIRPCQFTQTLNLI